ncbi:hypothetical protein DFJ73DRAFT_847174 [Zopfochytrium polystomum]|nr:hypothetical protein DFJ73DRAFT_847174 [Zopfochytrium polystomum]
MDAHDSYEYVRPLGEHAPLQMQQQHQQLQQRRPEQLHCVLPVSSTETYPVSIRIFSSTPSSWHGGGFSNAGYLDHDHLPRFPAGRMGADEAAPSNDVLTDLQEQNRLAAIKSSYRFPPPSSTSSPFSTTHIQLPTPPMTSPRVPQLPVLHPPLLPAPPFPTVSPTASGLSVSVPFPSADAAAGTTASLAPPATWSSSDTNLGPLKRSFEQHHASAIATETEPVSAEYAFSTYTFPAPRSFRAESITPPSQKRIRKDLNLHLSDPQTILLDTLRAPARQQQHSGDALSLMACIPSSSTTAQPLPLTALPPPVACPVCSATQWSQVAGKLGCVGCSFTLDLSAEGVGATFICMALGESAVTHCRLGCSSTPLASFQTLKVPIVSGPMSVASRGPVLIFECTRCNTFEIIA